MGRPLNKRYFGADANNNIKVQFNNGTKSVPGYILKQTGSKRFLCEDADFNQAYCYLVDKASADLLPGEMSITVKYDNGTAQQVTKIAGMLCTVDDTAKHWTFDPSTTDGYVQIEEAGTNIYLDNNTDLEGDEAYNAALDYPVPGSGAYQAAADALSGISYAVVGTPWAVGGGLTTVPNNHRGLRRTKYDGNFAATSGSAASTWTYNWFSTATALKSIADTYVSWGQQSDGAGTGEHNFSCEWLGYVQAPKSGNFNIYGESDDHIAMWIGGAATAAPAYATRIFAANNQSLPGSGAVAATTVNANTVTLTAGQWYPVRIWHSEFNGGCKAQVYFQHSDGTVYNGSDLTWAYNNATKGF